MRNPATRTATVLSGLFLLAMVLGPGPGLELVNPGKDDSGMWGPVPVLYAWAWIWFVVLATLLVIAERRIWSRSEEPEFEDGVLLDEVEDGPQDGPEEG